MQYQGPESVDDLPRSQRPERFVEPHPIFQFGQAVARVVGDALGNDYIRNMANVAREPDLMSAPFPWTQMPDLRIVQILRI